MENLILNGSEKTPHFRLLSSGDISFGGVSMPEDAADFYFKILDWISDYYRSPHQKTSITVSFRYLNSSSSSMIFKIFHCLNRLHASGKTKVKCNWYFEKTDDGMKNYIDRVMSYADLIEFKLYPTDNILDA
jgi:SiaC family regulatory phosphoprotein